MKDFKVLKWVYEKCGKRRREILTLCMLNAWSALCVTLFAMMSKKVMDYAQALDSDGLFKYTLFLLLIILSQMVTRVVSSLIEAMGQGKAEIALRTSVFSSMLYGDYASSNERHSGDIMARLTADASLVSDSYVSLLPSVVGYFVRIGSAAVALFALDKRFAILFIGCGALIIVVAALFRKSLKQLHRKVQERDAKVRAFMQEMIENLFAVKVFGIEKKVLTSSANHQRRLYKQKVKKKTFTIIANIGFSLAFAAGFLVAIAYGSYGIFKGTMSLGTVVAIIQLVNQLQTPVVGVTGVLPTFFAMTASAQRLIEVSLTEKEYEQKRKIAYEDFVSINAENVTFGYGDECVIENSDFVINKGDFVGIKGPSGAGKSTIFKLITGLYQPNEGSVVIKTTGGDVPCVEARRLYSVVPQGNMLFSGSVRENVTLLCPDATDEQIEIALKDSCAEFAYTLEGGLDFQLTEGGSGISEGQAQRLAVARALLGKGKILLMDESTSALDAESERRMLDNLQARDDITVLFITHRESVLEKCDRIITVGEGRISEN